jgi:hypothetical protein
MSRPSTLGLEAAIGPVPPYSQQVELVPLDSTRVGLTSDERKGLKTRPRGEVRPHPPRPLLAFGVELRNFVF